MSEQEIKSAPAKLTRQPVIAIDAGGVLVYKTQGDEAEESRRPMAGALEGLQALKELGFALCLVSFSGKNTAALNAKDMKKFYPGLLDRQIYVKNKHEKLAVCKSIGAMALIDDTPEILTTLRSGLYLGSKKEIKGMDILAILFTGDSISDPVESKTTINETQNSGDSSPACVKEVDSEYHSLALAPDWQKVVKICTNLQKSILQNIIPITEPDSSIALSKYVYCDLCIPAIPPASSIQQTANVHAKTQKTQPEKK